MPKPAHVGLRRKLSVIVVIVIAVVMLPFVMAAATFLDRQARAENERQLVEITRLVGDLVASQHEALARSAARLADTLALQWRGRFGRGGAGAGKGAKGPPELLFDGRPASRLNGELARLAGDDTDLVVLLARDGEGYVARAASRPLAGAAAVPFASLDGSTVPLARLRAGERWSGVLRAQDGPWLVELRPLADRAGRHVGLLAVGVDLARSFEGLRDRLHRFVIGESGYVFIVDAHPGPHFGRFVLHPTREGENLMAEVGAEGRATIEAILERGEGVLAYDWRNPQRGELVARRKLAVFARYPALDWVIGSSSYDDEFSHPSAVSRRYMIAAAALMALLLVVVLNLAIARLVVAPMLRMQRTLRTLSRGNEVLVHSADEAALVAGICATLVDIGGFRFARIGRLDGADGRLAPAAAAGSAQAFEAALDTADGRSLDPAEEAVRTRHMVHWPHVPAERPVLQRAAAAAGCQSLIAFPLNDGARLLGALSIGAADAAQLDRAGVALLQELADDLAFGIASQRTAAARRVAESSLRLHERALEASGDGVLIIELAAARHRLLYANPAVERITGLPREALLGEEVSALASFDVATLVALSAALDSRREAVVEMTGRQKDGSPLWCECSIAPVDDNGRVGHVVGVIKDVTERVLYLRQLERQAKYDALTGLPNRSLLDDRLEQALGIARRHRRPLAVAFVDLDHFKLLNDNLGHRAGDRLLQEVANRLAAVLGDGDTAARLGGDEFVILLPDLIDDQDAYLVLRRARQALARPVALEGRDFFVTASVGVSLYPKDGTDAETLLRNADIAMYQAKEAGRDTLRFFTAEMNARVQERMELEQELRQVLERRELQLNYQPVVEAASGRLVGAEALLRWPHPRLGAISPARFVPLAEELGLIGPIGEWVLATACREGARWQASGAGLRISVNVSARQFRDADFPDRVAAVLAETGLAPERLELELTESVLMGDADRASDTLQRLKATGVRVAIDDFGTGYSSFAYLRRLPLDTLKIDQSFVAGMEPGTKGEAIVIAIIAMAHSLGLRVIAEGVQSAAQQAALVRHGCDELQGEHFGRALDVAAFDTRLAAAG